MEEETTMAENNELQDAGSSTADKTPGRHDVFISYSTKNKNVADAIVSNFEQEGIRCWYAPRDILPGQEWVSAINDALEAAKVLVLIYTEESNDSRQVMNEVALAFNAGLTIVPFRLSEGEMNRELKYYLTRVHWLDAVSKPLSKNIVDLREYVEVILNKAPSVEAAREKDHAETKAPKKNGVNVALIGVAAAAVLLCIVLIVMMISGNKDKSGAGTDIQTAGVQDAGTEKAAEEADALQTEIPTEAEQDTAVEEDGGNTTEEASEAETPAVEEAEILGEGGTLMEDDQKYDYNDELGALSFGTDIRRPDVGSVTFLSSIPERTDEGIDISADKDGSVLAWYDKNNGYYDLTIASDGIIKAPRNCDNLFAGYTCMESIEFNGCFDTSDTDSMDSMFENCISLKKLDVTGFDVSWVENLRDFVSFCDSLEELDMGGWDTKRVQDMYGAFSCCKSLRSLDISGFNTAKVTSFGLLFNGCEKLESVNLGSIDTSSVMTFNSMFGGCSSLKEVDLSGLDTSSATNMNWMFHGCSSLQKLDISGFDTSKVENMGGMFGECSHLEELDVSGLDTSKVTTMNAMFNGMTGLLKPLDVSNFDTSNVTDLSLMFQYYPCDKLDVSSFKTSNVENMDSCFYECSYVKELDLSGWDVSKVTEAKYMFSGCKGMTVYVNDKQPSWNSFLKLEDFPGATADVEFVTK